MESPCELLARALGIAQYVLSQQYASDDDSFIVGCLLWMKECAGVSQGQRRASLVVWTVEVGALQGLLAKLKIRYGTLDVSARSLGDHVRVIDWPRNLCAYSTVFQKNDIGVSWVSE